jgi:integrase
MSSYVQKLYERTVKTELSDQGFEEWLKERYSKGAVTSAKSAFKQLKIMVDVKNKGTTWNDIVQEFLVLQKENPDNYLKLVQGFIQEFIDFSFHTRPCVRCYKKNPTDNYRGKRCPECQDTKEVSGVRAITIPNMITWIKKPMRYYGLLKGISNEDLRDDLILPTIEEEEPEPLTIPFIKAILNKVGGKRKLYWWFVATIGTRGSEGVQIVPSDCKFVDEEQMPVPYGQDYFRIKITLRAGTTKTKKSREIFVAKEIQKDMERLIKNTPDGTPLFRDPKSSITGTRDYNNELFREVCKDLADDDPNTFGILNKKKESGFYKFSFHSFRSFAVTQLNRVDYGFGHALAGHKVYMGMYNRLTVEQKKEYLEKSDEYLAIFTDAKQLNAKDRKIKELQQQHLDFEQFLLEKQKHQSTSIE